MKTQKALIVTDNTDLSSAFQKYLTELGYETVEIASVHEAMGLYPVFLPTLVLCDIFMNDGDGFDFFQHINESQNAGQVNTMLFSINPAEADAADMPVSPARFSDIISLIQPKPSTVDSLPLVAPAQGGVLTPDIFVKLFLYMHKSKFTGILNLQKDKVNKAVYFKDGSPTGIDSSDMSETFARMLLSEERITQEEYTEASELMKAKNIRFGEALVEMKIFKFDELYVSLKRHIIHKMVSCYSWTDGVYNYVETGHQHEKSIGPKIDPYGAILQATRLYQDFHEAANELSGHKGLYVQINSSSAWKNLHPYLNELERKFVAEISKKNQILDLLRKYPENIEDLFKFLWYLKIVDLISFEEKYEEVQAEDFISQSDFEELPEMETEEERGEILRDYLNLMNKNCYATLDLEPGATPEEVQKAYDTHSAKYNNAYINSLTDPELKDNAFQLVLTIRHSYETLIDPEKRKQYDLEFVEMKKKTFSNLMSRDAEVLFATALNMLKQSEYSRAENNVRKAIEINPVEALYHAYLGWIIFHKKDDDFKSTVLRAKEELNKALEINSSLAATYYFLGVISKMEGNEDIAERHFIDALKYDPAHIEANKQLNLLSVRKSKGRVDTGQYLKIVEDILFDAEK